MFNKKLKKENSHLIEENFQLYKTIKHGDKIVIQKNKKIEELKKELQKRITELNEKGYKTKDLEKTINKVAYWLPSVLDLKALLRIKQTHSGFNVLISPNQFCKPQFPIMEFIKFDSGSNSRDYIEISLGSNIVLNDIFIRQLESVFTSRDAITKYKDSITIYGGIKSVAKIIENYNVSLLKYGNFVSNLEVAKKTS